MIWGVGKPRREFLHVDDMAEACIHVMNISSETWKDKVASMCSHINVGTEERIVQLMNWLSLFRRL